MKISMIALISLTSLAACGSTSGTATAPATSAVVGPVVVVDAGSVAGCRFVTSITETQYSGMLFAGSGLKAAQTKVLTTAGRSGATHVVWADLNAGGAIQTATGSAYLCPA